MPSTMIPGARKLPLHHITIRVPWHDSGWNGAVCSRPNDNTSCLALGRIADEKDDAKECLVAGRRLSELSEEQLPPCVDERVTVLSPDSLLTKKEHPYVELSEKTHGHFLPTTFEIPAYGAAAVPFSWMLRTGAEAKAEALQITGFDADREPRLDWFESDDQTSTWVQEHDNQRALLDTFFHALEPEESLCFFYCKRTPLTEDTRRVIVGVGRVKNVGAPIEYEYTKGPRGRMRSSLWERSVYHSVRPGFEDGFVLPYQEILARAATDASIHPDEYVAFAPDELFESFSYGSELLDHDGAIAALLSLHAALGKIGTLIEGDWAACRAWIDGELNRLWRARGPFPGIGSALRALGFERGTLIAYELAKMQAAAKKEQTEDPWALIDQIVEAPELLPEGLGSELGASWRKAWKGLKPERRALLVLLSRFTLSAEQAEYLFHEALREECGIHLSDAELLANPYLFFELSRGWPDPIPFTVIDRGMFPDPVVSDRFPIPPPSKLDDAIDSRRVRAAMVAMLESAAMHEGHTLLPAKWLVQRVRDAEWQPGLPLSEDILPNVEPDLGDVIHVVDVAGGGRGFQLAHFHETRELIKSTVSTRTGPKAVPHAAKEDWAALVDRGIDQKLPTGAEKSVEMSARFEKTKALQTTFESRLSVLLGAAGTGKTTLLKTLCAMPQVKKDGVLLLAPTGKARVRLETATDQRGQGKTIAQFLHPHRYDGDTGAYYVDASAPKTTGYGTVIIDECSMLTEEQLAAVFDALGKVKRYVLVGDPRQLPPIGAGRPFVDIVRELAPENVESMFPRVGPGYAELTIHRRQQGGMRDDLVLASWFAGGKPDPSADEIWSRIEDTSAQHIRVVQWSDPADLETKLITALIENLETLTAEDDELGFEASLGGTQFDGAPDMKHLFFWEKKNDSHPGAGSFADHWQILSPIRGTEAGVEAINRHIQTRFRRAVRKLATTSGYRKIPKPFGPQQILYGDKVINVQNKKRGTYPKTEGAYVANGDIGIVVGRYRGASKGHQQPPKMLEVELSTQPGLKYGYWANEFGDDASPPLELAYALTVHKTQGSEFDLTFVVLPNPCWLLSRELLYTALTRHRDRIVILHQGPVRELQRFSVEGHSDIARRLTNLFRAPSPVPIIVEDKQCFLEDGLIHRTERGHLVRSKSELVIADKLHARKVDYAYEQPLPLDDGRVWYPDFTIEDEATGRRVYWEHLGLLHVPQYAERWEQKLRGYRANGICPRGEDGSADNGILIVTKDDEKGGLDAASIAAIIDEVFG